MQARDFTASRSSRRSSSEHSRVCKLQTFTECLGMLGGTSSHSRGSQPLPSARFHFKHTPRIPTGILRERLVFMANPNSRNTSPCSHISHFPDKKDTSTWWLHPVEESPNDANRSIQKRQIYPTAFRQRHYLVSTPLASRNLGGTARHTPQLCVFPGARFSPASH